LTGAGRSWKGLGYPATSEEVAALFRRRFAWEAKRAGSVAFADYRPTPWLRRSRRDNRPLTTDATTTNFRLLLS